MGMDLTATNPDCPAYYRDGEPGYFRFNITGWTNLRWLLHNELGLPADLLTSYNDGALVDAGTCGRIADALGAPLEHGRIRWATARIGRVPSTPGTVLALVGALSDDGWTMHSDGYDGRFWALDHGDPLPQHEAAYLAAFVLFLRDCGGFVQW